jgi:hypothetical protein
LTFFFKYPWVFGTQKFVKKRLLSWFSFTKVRNLKSSQFSCWTSSHFFPAQFPEAECQKKCCMVAFWQDWPGNSVAFYREVTCLPPPVSPVPVAHFSALRGALLAQFSRTCVHKLYNCYFRMLDIYIYTVYSAFFFRRQSEVIQKMTIQYFLWQYMLLDSFRVKKIIKKLTVLYTKSNVRLALHRFKRSGMGFPDHTRGNGTFRWISFH